MISSWKAHATLLCFIFRHIELELGLFLVRSSLLQFGSSLRPMLSGTVSCSLVALLLAVLLNELNE